ncbi:MAG: hypothetical protein CL610_18855 [Anaerolineaceae bacterium]|nr:hypothetical protein [Anaerolineaceae bacterium]
MPRSFRRRQTPTAPQSWEEVWQEDFPLFHFTRREAMTIGMSYRHVFVTGSTGSGKSSGSMATIFRSYLRAGYGGLVLSVKNEKDRWVSMCEQAGRLDDLVIVSIDNGMPYRFNFLDYQLRSKSRGSGSVTNIVELFSTIMDLIENNAKEKPSEDFWNRSALDLVENAVIVLSLCDAPLTMESIKRFITSAPRGGEIDDPDWKFRSYAAQRLQEAHRRPKTPRQERDLKAAFDYFKDDLALLNDRTRSSIEITVTTIASRFLKGDTRELLCSPTTNLVPEVMWENGKIVLLDMPIIDYGKEGIIIQGVIKYCFQRAMQQRDLTTHPRPLFLAVDEYQRFISKYDYIWISEVRSAGVAAVLATQSISNLYSVLGGGGRESVDSMLGNLSTVIIHACTDVPTCEWFTSRVGTEWREMRSRSQGAGGQMTGVTVTEQIEPRLLPSDVFTLKTGGRANDWQVEGYVVQTGRGVWSSTRSSYHKAVFRQEFGG